MSATQIKPLADRVVVKRVEAEEKTVSGIIIPETNKEKPHIGVVVATGPGRFSEKTQSYIPLEVKAGDKVVFNKWNATDVKVGNETVALLHEGDVIAILTDSE
jgi:chaperonin GroES